MRPETETVFIVDDDNGMRSSLRALIKSIGLRAEPFASAQEFLDFYEPDWPGCLLLDIRMPDMDGMELQQELKRRGALLPMIFITGHADVPMAVETMRLGAFDLILKPFRDQCLIDRVQHALVRDREVRAALKHSEDVRCRIASLTRRERQIMELLTRGKPNRVVAEELGLSCRTVEVHRSHLMRKMAVKSAAELVGVVMGMKAHDMLAQR